jgi:hypothetical protein
MSIRGQEIPRWFSRPLLISMLQRPSFWSPFDEIYFPRFTRGEDSSFRTLIDQFVAAEAHLQETSNPSGTISTGGLGEPKFNIDMSAFTGPWGR